MSFYRFDVSRSEGESLSPLSIRNTPSAESGTRFSIEVEDNGDGRLDERDHYVLSHRGRSQVLNSREGLRALNYYLNPENLNHDHLRVNLSRVETPVTAMASSPMSLSRSGIFTSPELSAIEHSSSVWFQDGHLDLALLEGRRVFTQAEHAAWTARPAHFPYGRFLATEGGTHLIDRGFVLGDWNRWVGGDLSWEDMRIGQIAEKVIIGFTFGALSSAVGSNLVWHLFTGNYTSNELGRIFANRRTEAEIRTLSQESGSAAQDLRQNIQVVRVQREEAQRNLYFGFTEPIIALACAADRDFWRWLAQVPRVTHFGEYSMMGFYAQSFSESYSALSGGVSASGVGLRALAGASVVAASSFLTLNEITQMWYDTYGHLTYRSTENKVASFISTVFSEAWLLSRIGRQLNDISGSSAFTVSNLNSEKMRAVFSINSFRQIRPALSNVNFQVVDLLRDFSRNFPLANLLTRRVIDPSLGELARNLEESAQKLSQAASRRDLLTNVFSGDSVRTRFQDVLFRLNSNVYRGYMTRELASASRSLSQAQQGLLKASENAESAGSAGRLGNNFDAVRYAVQCARELVSSSGSTATAPVSGVSQTLGSTLASAREGISATVRSGGFPEVVEELERDAGLLAQNAMHVARTGAVTIRTTTGAIAGGVIAEVEAMAPAVEAEVAVAGQVVRENRAVVAGGGGTAIAASTTELGVATTTALRSAATAAQIARAVSSAQLAARAVAAVAGVKVGLLVAGSLAVGVGIGTGIAYATGIYDEHYTPRDALRDFRDWIFE